MGTTIGLIILQMLTSRKVVVVGVSSSSSAHVVLSAGAVAVLDRNKGGLDTKGEELNFDVVIDCVGGQAVEDSARKAMGGRGHFVTIVGGGDGAFAEGATNQLA